VLVVLERELKKLSGALMLEVIMGFAILYKVFYYFGKT
jgi:hypothetical protein